MEPGVLPHKAKQHLGPSGTAVPLSQLLSPILLVTYNGLLFSYKIIWDQCLIELEKKTNSFYPATSMDNLLSSFEGILSQVVIDQMRSSFELLQDLSLGGDMLDT